MARINFERWLTIITLGVVAGMAGGCASQPAPEADPFAAIAIMDVRILQVVPAKARYIGRIYFTSLNQNNWLNEYVSFARIQAAKKGGNVVVPEISLGVGSGQIQPLMRHYDPAPNATGSQYDPAYKHPEIPFSVITPSELHFWSKVYDCPD